jgi:hypothetical protein
MNEEYPRKKQREHNKKKNKNHFRFLDDDYDKKKINQEFKKHKKELEEDEDWESWREYYNT